MVRGKTGTIVDPEQTPFILSESLATQILLMNVEKLLGIDRLPDGTLKVTSRERRDLEFKETLDEATLKKCLKTVAAFANTMGGTIVFGVTNANRRVCGINPAAIPDEAQLDDLLCKHMAPAPHVRCHEVGLDDFRLFALEIEKASMPPVLCIRDCQVSEGSRNKPVLAQGVVYYRRAGKSIPATGDEFRSMMDRRDLHIRQSILSILDRAQRIGFDKVSVVDLSEHAKPGDNVTLYVPEEAARSLNIIDRARLVEDGGAPAYEIKGSINLTTHSDKDPRKPLLPQPSARALKTDVERAYWKGIPWDATHLKKAAAHLGFWDKKEGDGRNTGADELTGRPKYFERGRLLIREFLRNDPEAFMDVVGSKVSRSRYRLQLAEANKNAAAIASDIPQPPAPIIEVPTAVADQPSAPAEVAAAP